MINIEIEFLICWVTEDLFLGIESISSNSLSHFAAWSQRSLIRLTYRAASYLQKI